MCKVLIKKLYIWEHCKQVYIHEVYWAKDYKLTSYILKKISEKVVQEVDMRGNKI